jgi:acetyltransferase-like isoleucine patch superfamily enzyme
MNSTNGTSYVSQTAFLSQTAVGDYSRVYERVRCHQTTIGPKVSIGDDSGLWRVNLESHIFINRRNVIRDSRLGRFSYTGHNATIKGATIGRFCSMSWNVSIGGRDHDVNCAGTSSWANACAWLGLEVEDRQYGTEGAAMPCEVGSDVWIATGAVVLRGVRVGNGAVIGAGAVVTRDVPPFAIVAGVPAKLMRMRFDEATVDDLQRIRWWDWSESVVRQHADLLLRRPVDARVLNALRAVAESAEGE